MNSQTNNHQDELQAKIRQLQEMRKKLAEGGGEERIKAQHDKGKQTARERIEKLVDPGTFQEIQPFMLHRHTDFGMEKSRFLGDGMIAGFAKINGRRVCLYAQDFTILGGSFSEVLASSWQS